MNQREKETDVGPGHQGRLVQLGLPPALVLGQRQRAGGHGQDHQQHRTTFPHGTPAHLPAGQGRGEPPAAHAQPVQQARGGRQDPQRQQGDTRQG